MKKEQLLRLAVVMLLAYWLIVFLVGLEGMSEKRIADQKLDDSLYNYGKTLCKHICETDHLKYKFADLRNETRCICFKNSEVVKRVW